MGMADQNPSPNRRVTEALEAEVTRALVSAANRNGMNEIEHFDFRVEGNMVGNRISMLMHALRHGHELPEGSGEDRMAEEEYEQAEKGQTRITRFFEDLDMECDPIGHTWSGDVGKFVTALDAYFTSVGEKTITNPALMSAEQKRA